MTQAIIESPLGTVVIEANEAGISRIFISGETMPPSVKISSELKSAAAQLQEYFAGNRQDFQLKLNPTGTEFQRKVWKELLKIPYGKTRSYLELAKKIGDAKAVRAVASANGKNPLWIVVPCHRVIGSNGSLTGYAGGLWRKKWLLDHESPVAQQSLF